MNNEDLNEMRFLRIWDVKRRIGLSRTTIYDMVAAGTFPKQIKLSRRNVAWRSSDLRAWMQQRETLIE